MIERGWVQAIVSTGALMTHGLSEGAGLLHFKHRPVDGRRRSSTRRATTASTTRIELEQNLDDVEGILEEALADLPDDIDALAAT